MVFPPADTGSIYPELAMLIDNAGFRFSVQNEIHRDTLQQLISNYRFEKIADCVLNVKENFPNSRRNFIDGPTWEGKLVDYIPVTGQESRWKETKEWIYWIVYDNHVVKIGMTSSGLYSRFLSYNCGTKIAMKKGSASTTNFVITECNYLALLKNMKVEIYAYEVPVNKLQLDVFGKTEEVLAKLAYKYEKTLIDLVEKTTGKQPILCGSI